MWGILSYLQDILWGGGDSVLVNKKVGGFCPFVRIPKDTIYFTLEFDSAAIINCLVHVLLTT